MGHDKGIEEYDVVGYYECPDNDLDSVIQI